MDKYDISPKMPKIVVTEEEKELPEREFELSSDGEESENSSPFSSPEVSQYCRKGSSSKYVWETDGNKVFFTYRSPA